MAATDLEKITLIDAEKNKEYSFILSAEDAEKVRNDHVFAYNLLQGAIREANTNVISEKVDTSRIPTEPAVKNKDCTIPSASTSASSNEDFTDLAAATTSAVNNEDHHLWSRAETLMLIELYQKNVKIFSNPKITTKQSWNILSKKMEEAGYAVSPIKCTTKWHSLKRTYKSVADHNKKSGNDRKRWEYYEIMHEIFGAKPWVKPIATAGSSEASADTTNVENEASIEQVPKKKKKMSTVGDYVAKSLELKKEREKAIQNRHEEKMSRLKAIEDLLTKMIEK